MADSSMTRRQFVAATSAGSLAAATVPMARSAFAAQSQSKLALKGGSPAFGGKRHAWPVWDQSHDEGPVLDTLRSGVWSRAERVAEFEEQYASLIGTKRCLATTNGTMSLITALSALDVGVGDEVLVGPYTFIASVNAIFAVGALPVFVDTDPETFLVDPDLMEAKITPHTRAILPVHIHGLPVDMRRVNAIAQKHDLAVVEDACQAWMSELEGQKCGSLGDLGCFSFQNSKNFTCGEGGAVTGDDDAVMDRAYSFHNFGMAYNDPPLAGQAVRLGMKCRMSEYQAAILMVQMTRLEEQTALRWKNAERLSARLREIPGVSPARLNEGVTCVSYYKYPLRFDRTQFDGVTRENFIRAMRAEGVPCSAGRRVPLNRQPFFEEVLGSRNFQRMYSQEQLEHCRQQKHCPRNDRLCGELVTFSQSLLLGTNEETDRIADAFEKVYEHRQELA